MRIIGASRPTGVSDYLVTLGGGREVLLDKAQFAHLATLQGDLDEIATTARCALLADEHGRLEALKTIIRLTAERKAP